RSGLRWRHRAEHTEKGRVCEEEAAEQTCRKDVPGESHLLVQAVVAEGGRRSDPTGAGYDGRACGPRGRLLRRADRPRDRKLSDQLRSEEHTSELQSRGHLVCRLLLEK